MAKLISRIGIVYGNRQYLRNDELPQNAPDTEDWVASGAAFWVDDDDKPLVRPKARLLTASPGLPGEAVGGEGADENLVGQVPKTPQRRRRKS